MEEENFSSKEVVKLECRCEWSLRGLRHSRYEERHGVVRRERFIRGMLEQEVITNAGKAVISEDCNASPHGISFHRTPYTSEIPQLSHPALYDKFLHLF
jgi:hypothetical protein